jgi:hypothetical protein
VRLPAQLTRLLIAAAVAFALLATVAQAGPDPGLCHPTSARADIPANFGVDACFDGSHLVLRNNLTLVLDASTTGDIGKPKRKEGDLGLAADAERLHSSDPDIFLPGDKLTYHVGSGAGTLRIRSSKDNGFYAIATTMADFFPGKATAWVNAFTGLVAELNDDFAEYRRCMAGANWLGQIGCEALRARNVGFAVARAGVSGLGSNLIQDILAPETWGSWFDATVTNAKNSLTAGGLIKIVAASTTTPKPAPTTPAAPALTSSSTCGDWSAATAAIKQAFAAKVSPSIQLDAQGERYLSSSSEHAAFMVGFISGGCNRAQAQGKAPADVPLTDVLAGDYPAPAPATTTTTSASPSNSLAIGSSFASWCVVAWPTAPTVTSNSIEMTMSCDAVPESEYLFTDVIYGDPNLAVSPDDDQAYVVGKVTDVATSDYGYKELVVQASSVKLK